MALGKQCATREQTPLGLLVWIPRFSAFLSVDELEIRGFYCLKMGVAHNCHYRIPQWPCTQSIYHRSTPGSCNLLGRSLINSCQMRLSTVMSPNKLSGLLGTRGPVTHKLKYLIKLKSVEQQAKNPGMPACVI